MSNAALALVRRENEAQDLVRSLDDVMQIGQVVAQSGMFKDVQEASKAVVKILAGRDLGIPPLASLRGIHVYQGKVEIGAGLLAAQIKASGKYDYRVVETTDRACVLAWFENGEKVGESSYTWKEAETAGLTSKDVWKKNPSDMLFARSLTRGQRRFAPDVAIGSVYAPGEISELDEPEPRDVTPNPAPVAQLQAQETEPPADDRLFDLIAELKIKAKNAGFSKAKELITFIAELLHCEECQASRFTEWLNTKKRGELELVIVALEEKAINPVDEAALTEALAAQEAAEPTPHEALAAARAEWIRLGGKEHSILRHMDLKYKVGLYAELTDEQASEMLTWLHKCILDVGVS